ncbi:protoporphyrinogen oxidase HemJ [Ectothiorhodospiraceae bacterium BW-2]|nr:protoporphyrinogen oxidase HemJ [Ectothiorhodospiraceae bacterium BW-2]
MLYIKAMHIVAVITWFAALFYLPRLFVYHAMSQDEVSNERFKVMERKLYRGIMTPSMVVATLLGLWLLQSYAWSAYAHMEWLHLKLVLVTLLIGYHFWCGQIVRQFRDDQNQRSHLFYRWFNEFPVLILITVVILAVAKPF